MKLGILQFFSWPGRRQFETDLQEAELARAQALSDLRQLVGYVSVASDYDVAGPVDYESVKGNLEDFQLAGLREGSGSDAGPHFMPGHLLTVLGKAHVDR